MVGADEIVVLITAPDDTVAQRIAASLVENRLAACVSLTGPVRSLYSWQGQIQEDEEVLLIVKTRAVLFEDQLVPMVKGLHPYQVPEIIALPIQLGSAEYMSWIAEVTR